MAFALTITGWGAVRLLLAAPHSRRLPDDHTATLGASTLLIVAVPLLRDALGVRADQEA